jgi:nitrous oxide reductase
MKPITETHPSLKGQLKQIYDDEGNYWGEMFFKDDVQEHTIDKAKLKEAMEKVLKQSGDEVDYHRQLKKELENL